MLGFRLSSEILTETAMLAQPRILTPGVVCDFSNCYGVLVLAGLDECMHDPFLV